MNINFAFHKESGFELIFKFLRGGLPLQNINFKTYNTPRIGENSQNTMREPSVSSQPSEEIEEGVDNALYYDAPGISEAAFSPLKPKLRPYIKTSKRFDPYASRSKTPTLAQRHQLFNRNKRTGVRSNRNGINDPQLTGKGRFKPSLWF